MLNYREVSEKVAEIFGHSNNFITLSLSLIILTIDKKIGACHGNMFAIASVCCFCMLSPYVVLGNKQMSLEDFQTEILNF